MSPDLLPAFFMAILACWLGLSLLVRSPRNPEARIFAWLCLHLMLYGLTISLGQLTTSESVRESIYRLQLVSIALLPPVFFHFTTDVIDLALFKRTRRIILSFFYVLGVILSGIALFSNQVILTGETPRFQGEIVSIIALLHRIIPLALAVILAGFSYQLTTSDNQERRHRAFFAIASLIAVIGAFLASVAREAQFTQAPGHILMDTGLGMMAYMVFAYRMLLPPRVARRAFFRSLLGGVFTAIYVVILLGLEPAVRSALAINTSIVTILSIVVLIAIFGPIRDFFSSWLDRRFFHREFNYSQLLQAMSEDLFERGDLSGQLEAALNAMCRTLDVQSGAVIVQHNEKRELVTVYGEERPETNALDAVTIPEQPEVCYEEWEPWPAARLLFPLQQEQEVLGLLILSSKRSGVAYRDVERTLIYSLCNYLALAIKHARVQQKQEQEMESLVELGRKLQHERELLEVQTVEANQSTPPPTKREGLYVYALGTLRVERDSQPIERWGGSKAGTYQAEALFAFLFDRCGRGMTKDEAEEVIWPDLNLKALDKADTAFHRTLSGLRRTLEPGLRRGNESQMITYHHERYWLNPQNITWCDVDAFNEATERGHTAMHQGNLDQARENFREAVTLYRDDYMYDCPFFGDSAYVEERRDMLRDQQIDALIALGTIYEQSEQIGEAATCYRRAVAISTDECVRAEEGLTRLQIGTT
ncbi:MAG: GAF domain-containing protein [Chloroflexota bacterium]